MRDVLAPGDTAIDIGAYKGGYTYWMRDAVGGAGRVFAFEPQPDLRTRLERMIRAFAWENVSVHGVAVSDEE